MSRKRIKQYLMLLTVVGLIAVAANGSGTFASFNAEVTNAGNTFSTGSLLLKDTIGASDSCQSNDANATGNATTCSADIALSNEKPGTADTGTMTLQNVGTLTGALNLTTTACQPSTVHDDTFNTGDPCTGIYMYVEEQKPDGTYTCIFGAAGTGGHCSTTWSDYTSGNYTIDDFSSANLTPGSTVATLTGGTTTAAANGQQAVFTFGFYLPDTGNSATDNAFQDTTATFPISWTLTQS